jgi:hypothetical protein
MMRTAPRRTFIVVLLLVVAWWGHTYLRSASQAWGLSEPPDGRICSVGFYEYVATPHDSWESVAQSQGLPAKQLKAANLPDSKKSLAPGDIVCIPVQHPLPGRTPISGTDDSGVSSKPIPTETSLVPPRTGDDSPSGLPAVTFPVFLAGVAVLVVVTRRRRKSEKGRPPRVRSNSEKRSPDQVSRVYQQPVVESEPVRPATDADIPAANVDSTPVCSPDEVLEQPQQDQPAGSTDHPQYDPGRPSADDPDGPRGPSGTDPRIDSHVETLDEELTPDADETTQDVQSLPPTLALQLDVRPTGDDWPGVSTTVSGITWSCMTPYGYVLLDDGFLVTGSIGDAHAFVPRGTRAQFVVTWPDSLADQERL